MNKREKGKREREKKKEIVKWKILMEITFRLVSDPLGSGEEKIMFIGKIERNLK